MKKPKSPCYGCKNRTAECHTTCNVYEIYLTECKTYRDLLRKERHHQGDSYSYKSFKEC